jgi:hypothetical protein
MVARRPHDCPTHPSVGHGLGSACCRASSGGLATGHETAWFRLALYFLLRAHCNALLHLLLTVAHPFRRCSVSLSKPWHLSNRSIQNCAGQPTLSKPIEPQFDPSHGGSQGFKSPHLHPTSALVTGLAGHLRRDGAVSGSAAGQQMGSNRERNGQPLLDCGHETERSGQVPDLPITSRTEAFRLDAPRTNVAAQVRDRFHPEPSCGASY